VAIVASLGPPAVVTATTGAPASTNGQLLVFTRAGGSYGEATLFVANSDGSDEGMLLENGEIECCAWVSRVAMYYRTPRTDRDDDRG
jgi:hypothetical protein